MTNFSRTFVELSRLVRHHLRRVAGRAIRGLPGTQARPQAARPAPGIRIEEPLRRLPSNVLGPARMPSRHSQERQKTVSASQVSEAGGIRVLQFPEFPRFFGPVVTLVNLPVVLADKEPTGGKVRVEGARAGARIARVASRGGGVAIPAPTRASRMDRMFRRRGAAVPICDLLSSSPLAEEDLESDDNQGKERWRSAGPGGTRSS